MTNYEKPFVYKGQTLNGKRHGVGQYTYPGGIFKYIGPWVDGVKHGEHGQFIFPGYFEHEGVFTDGEMTGPGTRTWADGRSYQGDWLRGAMHGRGTWRNALFNETYEGDFDDNRRHGFGILRLRNGDQYNGMFENHKYYGFGRYERSRAYDVEGFFTEGYVDSIANIYWEGIGAFKGEVERGTIAFGAFEVADRSFFYNGPFVDGIAASTARSVVSRLDRVAVLRAEQAALEAAEALAAASQATDAKKKDSSKDKKPPAGGKGVKEPETPANVVKVAPGSDLGIVHISMSPEATPEAVPIDAVIATSQPIGLPSIANCKTPTELRRRVLLELVPYTPPPVEPTPGAKGGKDKGGVPAAASAPVAAPEGGVANPVPLWHRFPSLADWALAWSRFPHDAIKFLNGASNIDSSCKFELITQETVEGELRKEEAILETSKIDGMNCFKIGLSSFIATSIPISKLKPQRKRIKRVENRDHYAMILDFCLDSDSLTTEMLKGSELLIPLMHGSIQHNQESRRDESCQIGLFFRAPCSAQVAESSKESIKLNDNMTPPVKPDSASVEWSNGIFELRYCLSGHPFDLVDSSCSVACASWIGGLSAPDHWHSVGINIIRSSKTTRSKASPPTEFVDPDEAKVAPSKSDVPRPTFTFGEEDIACNIDLFVDGVKRAHADDPNTCASPDSRVDNGPGYEGINDAEMRSEVASRWLNELGYLEVGTSKNNAEMTESVELTDEQVLKIALGGGHFKLYPKQNSEKIWFSGRVGSIVISSRDSECDLSECTGSFASWVKHKLASVENEMNIASSNPDESGAHSANGMHQDCSEVTSVTVLCRGGYGICHGIVIPTSTPEGMYALMVRDGTDDRCKLLQDTQSTSASDLKSSPDTASPMATDRLPGEMGLLYKCIPVFPHSRVLLIQVAAML